MTIKLYDTFTRSLREFAPNNENGEVGLYCCGPTVYHYSHIGNLRAYLFEDILRRALEAHGFPVCHVINITDVGHLVSDADEGEDKMEKGSARTGLTAWEIAEKYTEAFVEDLRKLNIKMPTIMPRATDHIAEQITFIQEIESKGFTYITSDGVYFDTSKDVEYGYLARLDKEGLQAGARVNLGEKRNSTDFALWKFSPSGEQRQMEWESPWGKGFPGWHIECSAMATKYLGSFFDIHCGGKDHIPVHHSNEIAQSRACHDTTMANFWMHVYFIQADEEKMSKSSGDFLRLATLEDKGYDPISYRYLCLLAHYRSDITFSWDALGSARTALNRLRAAYYALPLGGQASASYTERFFSHINDDLNTAQAIAVIWEMLKSELKDADKRASLDVFDTVLGLNLDQWAPEEQIIPDTILALAEQRAQAREAKDWARADALRDQLLEHGFVVKDSPTGPMVEKLDT